MINLLDAEIEGEKLIIGKRDRAMECSLNDYQCKLVGKAKSKSVILGIRPEYIVISKEKQGTN